jgi:hypothetical protein
LRLGVGFVAIPTTLAGGVEDNPMLRSLLLVLGVALTGSAGDTPQDSKKYKPAARVVKTKAALEAALKGLRVRVEQARIDLELTRAHLEELKLFGTREQIKKAYEEVGMPH